MAVAQGSRIEWTDATWNPVAGCTPVSPGCLNCYAARMALRLSHMPGAPGRKYEGTAKKARDGRPVFAGRVNLDWESLDLPRRWKLPRTIFVNSMSDLFHEDVPLEFIQSVFQVMEECPHHVFQVLTKRPQRALELAGALPWPRQVWLGTSVESRKYYDRIRLLQRIPAHIRFLSCEPLLGPLPRLPLKGIHWVIVGGESGPGARPMDGMWAVEIREQCEAKGVPFFFKQWGGVQKKGAGRVLGGRTWSDMPPMSDRESSHPPLARSSTSRGAPETVCTTDTM
jgi:protein gp37